MAKRILVVDDDPNMLLLVDYNLRKKGYEVETASDAETGLELAREGRFDLLILDLMLPGFTGFEICDRLRQEERFRDTPILMLTARSQIEDFEEASRVGVTDYITKPFDPIALAETLGQYLAPSTKPAP